MPYDAEGCCTSPKKHLWQNQLNMFFQIFPLLCHTNEINDSESRMNESESIILLDIRWHILVIREE